MKWSRCCWFGTDAHISFSTKPLNVFVISNVGGKRWDVSRQIVTKKGILERFPTVFARDLRTVDSNRMISEILIRDRAFVLKLEHIRLICSPSMTLIFDADSPAAELVGRRLQQQPMTASIEHSVLELSLSCVQGKLVCVCVCSAIRSYNSSPTKRTLRIGLRFWIRLCGGFSFLLWNIQMKKQHYVSFL